jgi:hypothetical protein
VSGDVDLSRAIDQGGRAVSSFVGETSFDQITDEYRNLRDAIPSFFALNPLISHERPKEIPNKSLENIWSGKPVVSQAIDIAIFLQISATPDPR